MRGIRMETTEIRMKMRGIRMEVRWRAEEHATTCPGRGWVEEEEDDDDDAMMVMDDNAMIMF